MVCVKRIIEVQSILSISHLRFHSLAFQKVITDQESAVERNFLTLICNLERQPCPCSRDPTAIRGAQWGLGCPLWSQMIDKDDLLIRKTCGAPLETALDYHIVTPAPKSRVNLTAPL